MKVKLRASRTFPTDDRITGLLTSLSETYFFKKNVYK